MSDASSRVRILCVRARRNPDSAAVLNSVVDEWVHALSLHCDVETIEEDFDLVEVYERVRPDFLLFDSIHWGRRHRLQIANIDAFPELPRALLLNSDPHDPMRPLTMEMVAACGIDTIFCTGTEDLEQMQELRRFQCFILPKFIDSAVFRDHGEARSIPLTIMSAYLAPGFYPWRAQVTDEVQRFVPTLVYPHPGYEGGKSNPFEIRDESYARMLARSQFCVADTTRLDYVVRKHLEIPAAGSVLVSPPSRALADYGFIDNENCILGAAGPELYARIIAVARKPELYEKIRRKGQALVHSRYTRQSWTHIVDWFKCRNRLKTGEIVQQQGVFGPFRAVANKPGTPSIGRYTVTDNPMAARLREAREAVLQDGDIASAVDSLHEMIGWIGHAAEPWLLMGVIALSLGDMENARRWLEQRSHLQGSKDPELGLLDPCEISWLLLVAYFTADQDLSDRMSACASQTAHVSIRRMQWLIEGGRHVENLAEAGLAGPLPGDRLSMHWLGDEDFHSWFGLVQRIIATAFKAAA